MLLCAIHFSLLVYFPEKKVNMLLIFKNQSLNAFIRQKRMPCTKMERFVNILKYDFKKPVNCKRCGSRVETCTPVSQAFLAKCSVLETVWVPNWYHKRYIISDLGSTKYAAWVLEFERYDFPNFERFLWHFIFYCRRHGRTLIFSIFIAPLKAKMTILVQFSEYSFSTSFRCSKGCGQSISELMYFFTSMIMSGPFKLQLLKSSKWL